MLPGMEAAFDYRIPVLHPLAVHLPVTLLLTTAVAALVWMFRGTPFWRRCCLFLILLSTPAALFAYLTGDEMRERSEGIPIVDDLVGLHERLALLTLVTTFAAAFALGIYALRADRTTDRSVDPIAGRVSISLLIFAAASFVAWTAHIGATMTWGVAP